MAYVKVTWDQIKDNLEPINREIFDATTEEDIRRHMIEDGEDPDAPLGPYEVIYPPHYVRQKLGKTATEMALLINVSQETWDAWETAGRIDQPAARALMRVLMREPEAALRALAG